MEDNARVREVKERALSELLLRQMMENTVNVNEELRSELMAMKGMMLAPSAMQNEETKPDEPIITEAAKRGVSIRGLRVFETLVKARCEEGAFSMDD